MICLVAFLLLIITRIGKVGMKAYRVYSTGCNSHAIARWVMNIQYISQSLSFYIKPRKGGDARDERMIHKPNDSFS
jgi:hypothetical protein